MKTKMKRHKIFMIVYGVLLLVLSVVASDCSRKSNPIAQVTRFTFPEPHYILLPDSIPFRFEISDQARFEGRYTEDTVYFCNISYPAYQAQLYCTWHRITPERFPVMAEESHRLVYQHATMASAIKEKMYTNDSAGIYGILYDLEGNVATPLQVALTDSVRYFFNASLYFDSVQGADSLAPVIKYIRRDVIRIMESFSLTKE